MGSAKTAWTICGCSRLTARDPAVAGAVSQILMRMNFAGMATRRTAKLSASCATTPNRTSCCCASQTHRHNDRSRSAAIRADFLDPSKYRILAISIFKQGKSRKQSCKIGWNLRLSGTRVGVDKFFPSGERSGRTSLTTAETDAACRIPPRTPHSVRGDSCGIFLARCEKFPSNQPTYCSLRGTLR